MTLVFTHFKAHVLEAARAPGYAVITLLFPAMLYLFFGVPNGDDRMEANFFMASYCAFAVLGIAFFQFGVGLAQDRESPWEVFLRTLPVSATERFAGRILTALLFGFAAMVVVVVLAHLLTPAGLGAGAWLRLAFALLAGSVPIALLGIALGYWASPKAALPVANVLYLGLAYAGGLWMRPRALPGFVAELSPYLPTRHYAEIAWAAVLGEPWRAANWISLAAFAAAFGGLAVMGYRRDEGRRYR